MRHVRCYASAASFGSIFRLCLHSLNSLPYSACSKRLWQWHGMEFPWHPPLSPPLSSINSEISTDTGSITSNVSSAKPAQTFTQPAQDAEAEGILRSSHHLNDIRLVAWLYPFHNTQLSFDILSNRWTPFFDSIFVTLRHGYHGINNDNRNLKALGFHKKAAEILRLLAGPRQSTLSTWLGDYSTLVLLLSASKAYPALDKLL